MNLLSDYTPDIEKFSIDEIFLDMTSTIHLFGSPLEVANEIRERIIAEAKSRYETLQRLAELNCL